VKFNEDRLVFRWKPQRNKAGELLYKIDEDPKELDFQHSRIMSEEAPEDIQVDLITKKQ